jgi:hypothetical protein
MTRADLLALRAAFGLRTGCHYIITDGPVIGTAGNTSPTQIELHAVSSIELGQEAKVHTEFDDTAWTGFYDIDLGTAGSLVYLVDPWNNRVSDPDADSPTVHTQFPWHAGGNNLRDNQINDAGLTAWGAAINAGGSIVDNEIRNSFVNLTGRTGGTSTFNNNRLSGAVVTLNTATSFFAQNNIDAGTVSHVGTGAGSFSFQNNTMLTGTFSVDATTTSLVTANNNVFGGTAGGFRVQVTGKTTGTCIFSGNRAFNTGGGSQEVLLQGASNISVTSNTLNGTNISLDGAGNSQVEDNLIANATVTKGATVAGPVTMSGCDIGGGTVTFTGTGAGGTTFLTSKVEDCALTFSTTSSGLLTWKQSIMTGATLTASASGSGAPVNQKGRVLATTLDTAGFALDTFDMVGGTKTLTANNTYVQFTPSFDNVL